MEELIIKDKVKNKESVIKIKKTKNSHFFEVSAGVNASTLKELKRRNEKKINDFLERPNKEERDNLFYVNELKEIGATKELIDFVLTNNLTPNKRPKEVINSVKMYKNRIYPNYVCGVFPRRKMKTKEMTFVSLFIFQEIKAKENYDKTKTGDLGIYFELKNNDFEFVKKLKEKINL